MASASDIGANFSNYVGNAALGGGSLGAFQIDTHPLQDFARYTMLANKVEYDQRQKDADDKVLEFVKLAAINLNDLRGKDRDELLGAYNTLIEDAREYAANRPTNAVDRVKKNLEWQLKVKKVKDDYDSGKARGVGYVAQKAEIQKTYKDSPKIMEERLAALDKEFDSTSIKTKLSAVPQYEFKAITEPTAVTNTVKILQEGANKDLGVDLTYFSPNNIGAAQSVVSEFDVMYIPEDSEEFKKLSKEQQDFQRGQNLKVGESGTWLSMTDKFNLALADEKNLVEGVFSEAKFLENYGKVSMMAELFNAMKGLNLYADEKEANITGRKLSDKLQGYNIPENFKSGDFAKMKINYSDANITPSDLALAEQFRKFEKAGGDKIVTKKFDQTNDANERARIAQGWESLGIQREQLNKSSTEDLISADAVIREVQDAIKMASPIDILINGKKEKQVKQIADPNLLKEFGTIDKDGNTTNVPDVVQYDPSTNQLSLVYYKREKDDNDKPTGEIIFNKKTGGNAVDRQVALNPTQWIGQITRRKNPNKDIGGVNALVEQIYNSFDRNLINLANGYGGKNATGSTKKTTTESSSTTTPQQGDEKLTDAEYYIKYKKAKPKQ